MLHCIMENKGVLIDVTFMTIEKKGVLVLHCIMVNKGARVGYIQGRLGYANTKVFSVTFIMENKGV